MIDDYYKSKTWKETSQLRKSFDGNRCQNCGSPLHLETHHLNYDRFGAEDVKHDLKTLCADCHEKITFLNRNKHSRKPYYTYGNREESTFWW